MGVVWVPVDAKVMWRRGWRCQRQEENTGLRYEPPCDLAIYRINIGRRLMRLTYCETIERNLMRARLSDANGC
jgi:hypothetical protein